MPFPTPPRSTAVLEGVSQRTFRSDILPAARPAILRGLVSDWPAVQAGRRSPAALAAYIEAFDAGQAVRVIVGPPSIRGRFFYDAALDGLNFETRRDGISQVMTRLLRMIDDADPPAVAIQSIPEPDTLPGFSRDNPSPLLDPSIPARLWIGNRATVQTHHDRNDNIACAVAGRRRFILFPPEQTRNLYIGPFEQTPAGAVVSMVPLDDPDPGRFPRFAEAWAEAEFADLEPGDALFIPYMWWHHVQSLDPFSVLVNYWWNDTPPASPPLEALIHGMVAVRDLPPGQRAAWRAMFDAFVFDAGETPGEHLPETRRGVQGALSARDVARLRDILARSLAQTT